MLSLPGGKHANPRQINNFSPFVYLYIFFFPGALGEREAAAQMNVPQRAARGLHVAAVTTVSFSLRRRVLLLRYCFLLLLSSIILNAVSPCQTVVG